MNLFCSLTFLIPHGVLVFSIDQREREGERVKGGEEREREGGRAKGGDGQEGEREGERAKD